MNLIEQIDREIKHHQSAVSALTAAKKLLTAPSALPIKNKKASYPTISHRRTRQRLPKTLAKILTIVRENPDCSSGEVANILIKEEVIKNGTHARNTVKIGRAHV